MARFTTLYSGSSGNSALVEENGRYLLVVKRAMRSLPFNIQKRKEPKHSFRSAFCKLTAQPAAARPRAFPPA